MIKGFKCKKSKKLYQGGYVKTFSGFERPARKRLRILDSAHCLDDLKKLPSNRFEKLIGDRVGQYSISINMQWRICFIWNDAPDDVEIVDYH